MSRPCTCDIVDESDPRHCRACWLWHHPEDPIGAYYHALWTGEPGLLQKAMNFANAAVRFIGTGLRQVTEEQYQERLAICSACEFFKDNRCIHPKCGCNLQGDFLAKARWRSEKCPINRWPMLQ